MKNANRLTAAVRPVLNRFPRIKARLNHIRLGLRRAAFKRRAKQDTFYADLGRMYVSPARITDCVVRTYDKWNDKGKVLDGDWDLQRKPFEQLDIFQAFRDHFLQGINWEDTEWYHRVLGQISSGKEKWCCKSREDFDSRCVGLDRLFDDIKRNGFKTQDEIPGRKDTPFELFDEISVCIDRDGRFLFEDGRHRLAIAKILNLTEIPVQVTLRHKQWHEFRCDLLAYAEKHQGKVYSPLPHPDLQDIPAVHGDKRADLIKQNLPFPRGSLLDIGAHWGYFCHMLEDCGFDCFAVESNATHLYFMEKLRKAEGKKFKIISESIFDYQEKTDFDVILALNIFHHFLKDPQAFQHLVELLGRLEMKVLFFEPHSFEEPQMRQAYRNYRPEEFVDFILSHSCLSQFERIGQAGDKRVLYKLTR